MTYTPETDPLAVVLDLGTPYSVSTDPLALDFDFLPAGEAQQLLANSLEANSSTSNAVINQTENLSAVSLESYTAVTNDALVEEFTNERNIESVSTTSKTVLSQVHSITASSLESVSTITEPTFTARVYLLAYDVDSWSKVSTSELAQVHSLQSQGVTCTPVISTGILKKVFILESDSIEAVTGTTFSGIVGNIQKIDVQSKLNINKKIQVNLNTDNRIQVNLNSYRKIQINLNTDREINHTLYQSRKVSSTLNLD